MLREINSRNIVARKIISRNTSHEKIFATTKCAREKKISRTQVCVTKNNFVTQHVDTKNNFVTTCSQKIFCARVRTKSFRDAHHVVMCNARKVFARRAHAHREAKCAHFDARRRASCAMRDAKREARATRRSRDARRVRKMTRSDPEASDSHSNFLNSNLVFIFKLCMFASFAFLVRNSRARAKREARGQGRERPSGARASEDAKRPKATLSEEERARPKRAGPVRRPKLYPADKESPGHRVDSTVQCPAWASVLARSASADAGGCLRASGLSSRAQHPPYEVGTTS
jgi:hypothetical protein